MSNTLRPTRYSLSAPGGGEGWGEVGDSRAPADTHLTLPALRAGPRPLPPEGRRGEFCQVQPSRIQAAALGAAQLGGGRDAGWGEIPGGLLRGDLDLRVERHEAVGDRHLLDDLDALRPRGLMFDVRHRHPAIDAADAEPVEDVRHQLLKAHVLHAGDTFGAVEIGLGAIAALLPLARIVNQELGDLAEGAALLAVVDDEPDTALLRGPGADLDPVHEVGPAGADVGAEHVGAIALVMDAAGDHGVGLADQVDVAEQVD